MSAVFALTKIPDVDGIFQNKTKRMLTAFSSYFPRASAAFVPFHDYIPRFAK